MSYILDALKDAARSRRDEPSPGLDRRLVDDDGDASAPPRRPRPSVAWLWPLLAVAALAGAAWYAWAPAGPGPTPVAAESPPTPSVKELAQPAAPTALAPPATKPVLPKPAPAPAPAPAPVAVPAPTPAPRAAVAPAIQRARAPGALPDVAELPEDLRRALPPIRVATMIDSRDPSQRVLIVNGRAYDAGQSLEPGLVLKEIHTDHAVFEFRGQRFRIAY